MKWSSWRTRLRKLLGFFGRLRRYADRFNVADRQSAPTASPAATPTPPVAPATLDPSAPPAQGRMIRDRFAYGVMTRHYRLYCPALPEQRAGQRLPLVVMLHGCRQDPDDFAAGTAMNEAAQRDGFFVLYPAQTRRAHHLGCWNWYRLLHQQRDLGEPGLLAALVRQTMARHPIDPERVFVTGLSAGGAMAAILGEAYPELFSAIAVHAGVPVGLARSAPRAIAVMKRGPIAGIARRAPSHALPLLVVQGMADGVVHPDNAQRLVDDARMGLAARTGPLQAQRETAADSGAGGHRWTRETHRDDHGHAWIESWSVDGLAHAWSGGRPTGSYTDPAGPDATAITLRFFEQQRGRRLLAPDRSSVA